MNTIRHGQNDEPATEGRSHDQGPRETEAGTEAVCVVGDSMSGKGDGVTTGDLSGQTPSDGDSAGVRAAVVAMKPGNAGGAKGGRKADTSEEAQREATSPKVPPRDKQGEEDLWQCYGAEHGVWSQKMLEALARGIKGNKWFSLIDKVRSERTLGLAWEKVKTNAGVCGVDNTTVARFEKDSENRLLAVREQLKEGSYQPRPVKRVWIPKAGRKEKRPLGIPTVTDRVVQTALKMVIEPIFEKEFAPQSYGFRPNCGCKDALRQVDKLLKQGQVHVVDVDIKGYFDSIDHRRLMELVEERIADGPVLELIESYLKQGVMETVGEIEPATDQGTPQGGVVSPLLANIYLNPLDWQMERTGHQMVRYADDMVILCSSAQKAQEVKGQLEAWCEQARLELHPEKTKIVDMGQARACFDFLGYRFLRTKGGKLIRTIRPKSYQAIKARIKPLTQRANGWSMASILDRLRPILRGFHSYFYHTVGNQHEEMDSWVRGRLRSILRKRHKGKGRGRGLDHHKWPNHYFEQLGLFSLEQARQAVISSPRTGANC